MTEVLEPLYPLLPELVLAGGAILLLLIGAFEGERATVPSLVYAMAILALAGLAVLWVTPDQRQELFGGSFVADPFAKFLKLVAIAGSFGALWLSGPFLSHPDRRKFEYPVLVLLATVGMLVLISAGDLVSLYLGLELMSLALYVMAAFDRDDARSTEAGLKYFVLGALSSGMLLYGASLIYGFTGTVRFAGIAAAAAGGGVGVTVGLVLLFAGLCFKVSAVPFHMWTPDVYQGSPTPVTAFFASAPKVAAIAAFMRVCISALPHVVTQWQQVVVFVAIASMALGAFAAIGQRNIKRLMAYSSIGHMGFALVGLAAASEEGIRGVLIYMAIYVAMTLGVFAAIITMRRGGKPFEDIADLAGLARTSPALALALAIMMFSLAGIPPLAGFFAKYYVFMAAVKSGLFTLAVLGVLASVVGCYYYLLIVKVMYFDDPAPAFDRMDTGARTMVAATSAFVLLFVLFAGPIVEAASAAARSLF